MKIYYDKASTARLAKMHREPGISKYFLRTDNGACTMRILVIEDEKLLADSIRTLLK